jgi:hypothetical protein
MKKSPQSGVQRELDWLDQEEEAILKRMEAAEKNRQKLESDRIEQQAMLPPSELIRSMEARNQIEDRVTRKQDRKIRHDQQLELLKLFLLMLATAALVWWGLILMRH